MRTEELDDRLGAWGYPRVSAFRLPEEGDLLELPEWVTADPVLESNVARVVHIDRDMVSFEIGTGDEVMQGHLRMSITSDGLHLYMGGTEYDGYSCRLVEESAHCPHCGTPTTRWSVQRGRQGE